MSHYFYVTPDEYQEAAKLGIRPKMLDRRIRQQGWTKQRAMTTPPRPVTDRSEWRKVAEKNGVKYYTFMNRVKNLGWSEEKAATKPLQTAEETRLSALKATDHARVIPEKYIRLAEQNGINYHTFHRRYRLLGWEIERAATEPVWSRSKMGAFGARRLREREGDWSAVIFRKGVRR